MFAVQIVLLYIQAFIASTSLFADLKYKDISEIYKMRMTKNTKYLYSFDIDLVFLWGKKMFKVTNVPLF